MQKAQCYLLGERAAVLELEPPLSLESQQRIWVLTERLIHYPEVREVIPGMNNITILLELTQLDPLNALEKLQGWWEESEVQIPEVRDVMIPVIYGGKQGPDLAEVAQLCGLTPHQVVEQHSTTSYVVFFLGFQPGFAYLGGLPEILHTPRRSEPRLSVAQGSVGIGGAQTGIYPLTTPGGWQIIGRTSLALFNPYEFPPTLLRPGDNVRFVPQKEGIC